MAEQSCSWHFGPASGADLGPNDILSDTFSAGFHDLVRESIQNSLDACDDHNKPVTVSFKFKKLRYNSFPQFFKLEDHVRGCMEKFPNNEDAKDKFEPMLGFLKHDRPTDEISYLEISDFNTMGMDYVKDKTDCPFYAFALSKGNTVKNNASSGGSHGYGKGAYFNVSAIRSLIISTLTKGGRHFFIGESSLSAHVVDGKELTDTGFYTDNDDREPISRVESIPERFRREVPGTNFDIMGIDFSVNGRDECYKEITKAALQNFWLAIYHEKLVLLIDDTLISKENLDNYIIQYFPDFADSQRGYNSCRPYYEAVVHAQEDNDHLLFKGSLKYLGDVCLFLLRTKSESKDKIQYIRSLRMVVYTKPIGSSHGCYGVLFCDSGEGNRLLKATEDATHSSWNPRIVKNKEKRKMANEAISEMNNFIIDKINSLFTIPDDKSAIITGADEYLTISSSLDENQQGNGLGKPSGKNVGSGNSDTSAAKEPIVISPGIAPKTRGAVLVPTVTTESPDSDGPDSSGNNRNPINHEGDGGPGKPSGKRRNRPDPEGRHGTYGVRIEVRSRSYAFTKESAVWHRIIIKSEEDIDDGRIEINAVDENGKEEDVDIIKSDKGEVDGSAINNLSLVEGTNTVDVQFDDNIRYSLTLSAFAKSHEEDNGQS